jgi:hypothetical protein
MIGTVSTAGTIDDTIDALMVRTNGERLAPPSSSAKAHAGGEYDAYTDYVSRRDMRRLVAAGLVSSHGMQADQLAHQCGWEGTADTFVAWYLGEALKGLDIRRSHRDGKSWADQVEPDPEELEPAAGTVSGDLPGAVLEYLLRLVFGQKADYAAEYAYHVCQGAPCPQDPGTDWARKARSKIDSLTRKVKP